MEKSFFEDCNVGDKVLTPSRTISQTDLVLFAAHFSDWLPSRTDGEYAIKIPFGERITHGMLLLAIGSALLVRLGDFAFLPKSSIAVAEVGKLHFHAPMKVGDTIYLEAEVINLIDLDKSRGLIVIEALIKNQHEETLISSTAKVLTGRRPYVGEDIYG